jgi:hypothetical protein
MNTKWALLNSAGFWFRVFWTINLESSERNRKYIYSHGKKQYYLPQTRPYEDRSDSLVATFTFQSLSTVNIPNLFVENAGDTE